MQPNFILSDTIEYTQEKYLSQIATKSQLIYVSILVFMSLLLISLPFIYVDVTIQSKGIVRPVTEKNEIRASVSGIITGLYTSENSKVKKGQMLISIKSDMLENRLIYNKSVQNEKRASIADLDKLVHFDSTFLYKPFHFRSPLYQQQFTFFTFQLKENINKQKKIKKELDADTQLYQQKAIAKREFDSKQYEYQALEDEYNSKIEQQISQWQTDNTSHKLKLAELRAEEEQLLKEKDLYNVFSPVEGNIQQISGKYKGSYLQAGEVIGVISPDSSLIAECYILPQDIGFVRKGLEANFQVDAFNYNEWGMIRGKITEVAHDFILIDNRPVFKVYCKLDKNYLKLNNGYKGQLKKGMTLGARFLLTRRSLFQLLYDKADDWMNPSIK